VSTLRAWCLGQQSWNRTNRFHAVVQIADMKERLLSFRNLIELHVLSSLRRHAVPLKDVRRFVARFRRELGSEHPLADASLSDDGAGRLFVDIAGKVFNVSAEWQQEMQPVVESYLEIEEAIRFNHRARAA
jgi:hypothetical protein